MSLSNSQRWKLGGGVTLLLFVLIPLLGGLRQPGLTIWNVFLALFLLALAVGVFLLQRHFVEHVDEIGEARFDTRNKSEIDG